MLEEEERERHKLDRKIVARRALDALRRDRAAQAQHAPRRRARRRMRERREAIAARGHGDDGGAATPSASGELVIEAEADRQSLRRARRSCAISRSASCAATGSASSAPTAPARRRCSNLLTGALAPGHRHGAARRQSRRWRRSTSSATRSIRTTTLADALTGGGGDYVIDQRRAAPRRRLHARLPVPARAGAHADRQALRRRARPADAGAARWRKPSNLLVLDEPTNDLDIETLDLLQDCSPTIPAP